MDAERDISHLMEVAERLLDAPRVLFRGLFEEPLVSSMDASDPIMPPHLLGSDGSDPLAMFRRVMSRQVTPIHVRFVLRGSPMAMGALSPARFDEHEECPCARAIHDHCADLVRSQASFFDVARCLSHHADDLPKPCGDKLRHTVAGACSADLDRFCADVRPGGNRIHLCLANHAKELSDSCIAYFSRTHSHADRQPESLPTPSPDAEAPAAPLPLPPVTEKEVHLTEHPTGSAPSEELSLGKAAQASLASHADAKAEDEEGEEVSTAAAAPSSSGSGGRSSHIPLSRTALVVVSAAMAALVAVGIVAYSVYRMRRRQAEDDARYQAMMT